MIFTRYTEVIISWVGHCFETLIGNDLTTMFYQ